MIGVGLREYMERTCKQNVGNASEEFCYNKSREIKWELKEDVRSGEDLSFSLRMGRFTACFYAHVNDTVETEELTCKRVRGELS